jgi:hypothetical protein
MPAYNNVHKGEGTSSQELWIQYSIKLNRRKSKSSFMSEKDVLLEAKLTLLE